jgi:hypothetical protein
VCKNRRFYLIRYTTGVQQQPETYYIISYHILSYPIPSYPILSYHIISYIISYPILSYPIPSYPILSYHIISYQLRILAGSRLTRFTTFVPVKTKEMQQISATLLCVCDKLQLYWESTLPNARDLHVLDLHECMYSRRRV